MSSIGILESILICFFGFGEVLLIGICYFLDIMLELPLNQHH
jgi:hypothetical protein